MILLYKLIGKAAVQVWWICGESGALSHSTSLCPVFIIWASYVCSGCLYLVFPLGFMASARQLHCVIYFTLKLVLYMLQKAFPFRLQRGNKSYTVAVTCQAIFTPLGHWPVLCWLQVNAWSELLNLLRDFSFSEFHSALQRCMRSLHFDSSNPFLSARTEHAVRRRCSTTFTFFLSNLRTELSWTMEDNSREAYFSPWKHDKFFKIYQWLPNSVNVFLQRNSCVVKRK